MHISVSRFGLSIDRSDGSKTLYERASHPLLLPHEDVVLKQKTTLPQINDPLRRQLNNRVEWRSHVGRGGHEGVAEATNRIVQVGRRRRVNSFG